jgi:C_GCAxxG_C_C family probable redox protein
MSKYIDCARELRACTTTHYNCAQSVVVPFAEDAGMTREQAIRFAANFGAGMKMAATCGAITGGLMVLGLFGVEDGVSIAAYYRAFRERHNGYLNCADLLRINKEQGREKKPHCDAMVFESVELVEKMLRERGKL